MSLGTHILSLSKRDCLEGEFSKRDCLEG